MINSLAPNPVDIPEAKLHRFARELATALDIPALPPNWWWHRPDDSLPAAGTEGVGACPGWIAALRYRDHAYVIDTAPSLKPGQYVVYQINPADHSGHPDDPKQRPATWWRTLTGEQENLALQAARLLRARHHEPPPATTHDDRVRVLVLEAGGPLVSTFEPARLADARDAARNALSGRSLNARLRARGPITLPGIADQHGVPGTPLLYTLRAPEAGYALSASPNAAATSLIERFGPPDLIPDETNRPHGQVYDAAALVVPRSADVGSLARLADTPPRGWLISEGIAAVVRIDF